MLFKATRARLHGNCGVSTRRKRQTDDQLQPLDNSIMTQALNSGRQQIEQVSLMSLMFSEVHSFYFYLNFTHDSTSSCVLLFGHVDRDSALV